MWSDSREFLTWARAVAPGIIISMAAFGVLRYCAM
jgi:hypothetical protein